MNNRLFLLMVISLFIGFAASVAADKVDDEGPNETQVQLMESGFQVFKSPVEAPDFTTKNLDGEEVSLSSFQGKTVLLNFWATWCPPCRAEMPSMQVLYEELRDEGIELVAVDLQEPERTVKKFIEEHGYTFPILLDSRGTVGAQYGVRSIPTTFIINAEGYAIAQLVGSREWESEELYEALRNVDK
jgi:DsbE subfamily thiol:disulfide oxidoreductase